MKYQNKEYNFSDFDYLYNNDITVKTVADSSILGKRVTTFLIRMPKFINAEMNTHRVFSRNVASSRANRFSQMVAECDYYPKLMIANHKGMQGKEILPDWKAAIAQAIWQVAKYSAIGYGYLLDKLGVSKQYTNRLIEPFSYINYLVTSTDWDNFLALRDNDNAQFEIQIIARQIKEQLFYSTPKVLKEGEWHLPFINDIDYATHTLKQLLAVSAAKCARTSYNQISMHNYNIEYNLALKLQANKHMSPFEHQVRYDPFNPLSGNFSIGTQYRKLLEQELDPETYAVKNTQYIITRDNNNYWYVVDAKQESLFQECIDEELPFDHLDVTRINGFTNKVIFEKWSISD